jgi:hypothetical protein
MAADDSPDPPATPTKPAENTTGGSGPRADPLTRYFEIATKPIARPATDELEALQRVQVIGNRPKQKAGRHRRLLQASDDIIEYNGSSFANRSRNIMRSLRSAIGLVTYARFYMGVIGWQQAEADEYLDRADKIAIDVLTLPDFARAGVTDNECRTIEVMFQAFKSARESYFWRRGTQNERNDDVSILLKERVGRSSTAPAMRHAHFFHRLRDELSESDPAKLHKHAAQVRKDITSIINTRDANKRDPMFQAFDADLPMQANYDANTVIARLYECDAKLLILHSLSCGGRMTDDCFQQVTELLNRAEHAFDACEYKWWHGYGNFIVTLAVFDYAQGRLDAFRARMQEALPIFRDTNDLWRMAEVAEILNKIPRSFILSPKVLSLTDVLKLLFNE